MEADHAGGVVSAWRRLHPHLELTPFEISLRAIRAGRILEDLTQRITSEAGLAVRGDYEVLASLRRIHPTPSRPVDLAERVMVTTAGMTGRLDRLENAGLIKRRPHSTDRRSLEVVATDKGVRLADQVFRALVEFQDELLRHLPPEDQRRITSALASLAVALGDVKDESGEDPS